jgi:type II secretory pathway component GspD/PulD (secretin)
MIKYSRTELRGQNRREHRGHGIDYAYDYEHEHEHEHELGPLILLRCTKRWLIRGLMTLALAAFLAPGAQAGTGGLMESTEIQKTNANPSPAKADSNVNDYTNQSEQIYVQPTDGLVKVLRTDQKNLVNDYITEEIPLLHAPPREIRNVMRQVTAQEGGRAEVIIDKITKQNYIQVLAPRYMMPYLREAVAALDVDWLKEYWDGATDVYVKMQHRDAAFVDSIASTYAGDEGFSTIDKTNNALRRYDEEYRNKEYVKAIGIVDIPANQVLLDVKICEVNSNNDLKLGLDYINWKNGPGRNLWSFAAAGFGGDQRAKGLTSVFDPFLDARGRVPGDQVVKVLDTASLEKFRAVDYLLTSNFVDFLQSKGVARVVNSQKLLVASANTGVISADEEVLTIVNNENDLDTVAPDRAPVFIVRNNSGAPFVDANHNGVQDTGEEALNHPPVDTSGAPASVKVQDSARRLHYKRAGVVTTSLSVTPYVGLQSMELELGLDIGELNGIAPSGLPIINTRTVSTTVRLLDGQPYVIAGLKRSHNSKETAKVPFLGSIPVVGYLFGGETNLKRENDVVITITPHFILASQTSIATAPRVKTVENIITGEAKLGLPENKPGFDQWLLGS